VQPDPRAFPEQFVYTASVMFPERKSATLLRSGGIDVTFFLLGSKKNTGKLFPGKMFLNGQPVTNRLEIPPDDIDLIRFKKIGNPGYLLRGDPDVP